MKKGISIVTLLTLTVFLFVSCNSSVDKSTDLGNEAFQAQLDREQVIKGFMDAIIHFNENKKEIKASKAPSSVNQNIQEQYVENLNLINSKTGLNLNYKTTEIDAFNNNLIGGLNEVYISDEQTLRDIEKIKADGNYELLLEVQKILNEVYSNASTNTNNAYSNTPQFRGKGWSYAGCGLAVASNFVATLGLAACATGVGCPLAIAGKVLAYGGLVACIGSLA